MRRSDSGERLTSTLKVLDTLLEIDDDDIASEGAPRKDNSPNVNEGVDKRVVDVDKS